MTRWQPIASAPSGVIALNRAGQPSVSTASTLAGVARYRHSILPSLIAERTSVRLPSLQRENSSLRLMRITRFCAARAIAFSIAASPAPTTTIVSSSYSFGSSSWYWTTGRSSPLTPSLRRLPWRPIASTTCAAFTVSPPASLSANAPFCPLIAVTPAPLRRLTLCFARPSSHAARTCSRVPAANARGLRNGRIAGSAITYLPFWYL